MSENINAALHGLVKPVSELKPDSKNARRHEQRSIEAIQKSLVEFGQQKPIVILRDGTVIAGNGTLQAATSLGWKHLACVTFDDVEKARAFAIADNRAAELSTWDVEELLGQLEGFGDLNLGFTDSDIQDFVDIKKSPFITEKIDIAKLKEHPRNYRKHPEDQLKHIMKSIETHGFYRNVVVANDDTILAGHGVVEAAKRLKRLRIPIIRLNCDPNDPRALKVLTSDNEIRNLAEVDDRALTDLLKELMDTGGVDELLGTGFDQQQLSILAFVTRPASEIADHASANEWVGLPSYEDGADLPTLVITFNTAEDRIRFVEEIKLAIDVRSSRAWSTRWPWTDREDRASVRFVDKNKEMSDG